MSLQDKSLQCSDCGATFTFSAKDQEFFQQKGFTNEPKRCPACREARKAERGGGTHSNFSGSRQTFPATCSACGKATEVPFQPRGDKPVYCRDCYRKTQAR
jgi:CxxC-x17-CxxC domain-containing protein